MDSGIKKIDDQKNSLFSRFEEIRRKIKKLEPSVLKKEALELKKDIRNFRIGLGASRGTEFLEGRFKWKEKFKKITQELDQIIDSE